MKTANSYQKDFYAWAIATANLIRDGRFVEIDKEHVAEEIESMGRSDKRELINRLAVLMMHLLKWQYQPSRRSKSWKYTLKEQRFRIAQLLDESPSLKYEISQKLNDAYALAIVMAVEQTGLDDDCFPAQSPFNFDQCLDADFYPEEEEGK